MTAIAYSNGHGFALNDRSCSNYRKNRISETPARMATSFSRQIKSPKTLDNLGSTNLMRRISAMTTKLRTSLSVIIDPSGLMISIDGFGDSFRSAHSDQDSGVQEAITSVQELPTVVKNTADRYSLRD